MQLHRMVTVCLAASLALAGSACGRSDDEKQAEQAKQAAEQGAQTVEKSAEQAAKGLEEMAKSLGALAGNPNQKTVEPVSFRELQKIFPDLEGWEKRKPTGERMSSPVSFSQAQVEYTNGDRRVEVKVVDSGFSQILMAPYAMFLTSGYEKETKDGYEKSTTVAGHPGWEKWNSGGKDGELNALVSKRFLVTFEGSGIEDTKVLHDLAQKTDLAMLAGMK